MLRSMMFRIAVSLLALSLLSACAQMSLPWDRDANPQQMVAAAHPLAVEAGLEVLNRGGTAMDAAVAVQAALSFVEPQSSGLGGGAFLLYADVTEGRLFTYDGRETAPASATPDLFLDENGKPRGFREAVIGGKSVGVPGVVAMLGMAHQRHGRRPWGELFAPAERIATEGFAMGERLHALLGRIADHPNSTAFRALYYDDEGNPHPVGHVLRDEAYARTLRLIAEGGPRAFYEGEIAEAIVRAVGEAKTHPAVMTLDDLAGYEPKQRPALCGPYRQWLVCSMGPPSSGGIALLQILGMLEDFDMASLAPNSADAVHLIAEASRLAFADRNHFVADSDFVFVPVRGLLDRDYLRERAALIDVERSMGEAQPGDPLRRRAGLAPDISPEQPSTSHFSIVDRFGNVASMTTTIESAFGSRQMAAGFILNNELTDFSFEPVRDGRPVANRVEAGKRPRSSMTPTIIFDENGDFYAAIGSPGGPLIIGYVTRAVIGLLDWGLSMEEAVSLPHAVNLNTPTLLEKDTALEGIAPALEAMGHEVRLIEMTSGLHGIRRLPDGTLEGAADPRREGAARSR
jgi:gamma-glutamyltranspeptidase/glutathione hydrolase